MKRRLLPIILSMILFTNFIYAQSLNWVTDGGGKEADGGAKVTIDSDGHLITGLFFSDTLTIGGEDFFSVGGSDCLIVKYDGQGEVIWAKQLRGLGWISASSLAVDKNNNIYVLGSVAGEADLDPSSDELIISPAGYRNTFFAKYTSDGNIVWGLG